MQLVPLPAHAESVLFAGLLVHVPADPAMLQALHVPHDAVPQQVPSTQNPLWHSVPPPQAMPLVFLVVPQDVPVQFAVVQSALPAHVDLHAVALAQINDPGHALAVPFAHVPMPSQVFGVSVDPAHAEPQDVPRAAARHPPVPLQVPSRPQVVPAAVQALCADLPAMTGRHCPDA